MNNQQKKQQSLIDHLMEKEGAEKNTMGDRIIVTYYEKNALCAAVWVSNMPRPVYHYAFSAPENRNKFVAEQMELGYNEELRQLARRKEAEVKANKLKPGAILFSSWGYEQTNIDFYIVLERKPASVVIQEIAQHKRMTEADAGICTPDPDTKIGSPFLKMIDKHGTVRLNSYSYCDLWDGREKRWSSYH